MNESTKPASATAYTGRIVAIAGLVFGLIAAAAPVALDMDLSSTAGVVGGIVALSAVIVKYLEGWQRYEARLDASAAGPAGPTGPAASPVPLATDPAMNGAATDDTSGSAATSTATSPTANGSDPAEPGAPLPGDLDKFDEGVTADEVVDIPDPPSDEEVAAELASLSADEGPAGDDGRRDSVATR